MRFETTTTTTTTTTDQYAGVDIFLYPCSAEPEITLFENIVNPDQLVSDEAI